MKYNYLLLLVVTASLFCDSPEIRNLPKVPQQYQDLVVNGNIVKEGVRECSARYEAIKPLFEKYDRPITVLDLGAAEGYFSFRLAHDFPHATCVMIEAGYSQNWNSAKKLKRLCELNTELDNVILLDQRLSNAVLSKLAECEHFDVILAFNILHHIPGNKNTLIKTLRRLGDHVIIETPCDIALETHNALKNYPAKKTLGQFKRHTSENGFGQLSHLPGTSKKIAKKAMLMPACNYPIVSNFSEKYLIKQNRHIPWQAGINLCTFKCLNGIFRKGTTLTQSLRETDWQTHPDLTLWNIIIQGEKLRLIDNKGPPFFKQGEALAYLELLLSTKTLNEFQTTFSNKGLKPKRIR